MGSPIIGRGCLLMVCLVYPVIALAGDPGVPKGSGEDTPPPMTDIHDIKPLVDVGRDLPWPAILIGLLILAVLLAAFFYWRHFRKSMVVTDVVAELAPEVNARRALNGIADVAGIDGKSFYFSLSAILRQYLYERFRLNAPEMTTEELLPQLETLNLSPNLYEGLARLCRGADPIKYAKERPQIRQMEQDLAFARRFVEDTTPGEIEMADKDMVLETQLEKS